MATSKIVIKIDGDTKGIDGALSKTDKGLKKTRDESKKTAETFKKMKSAGVVALVAIGAAAVKAVKDFAKFDNEMRGVKTLLDENSFGAKGLERGFKDMTDQVKDLGRRVPVDLGAMNKALFDTVSAGIDASKAVNVLEVSAKLAVAGLTDVSTATNGMTSAMNAYQISAEDAEEVASKFFVAQKKGKTTIAELSNGFGLVGASAAAFGVKLDELLSAVSAVTTAGVRTNAAYTGLKAVFANISAPTAKAAKEAKNLKIAFDSVTLKEIGLKAFFDQITNSVNFSSQSIERLFGSTEAQNIAFALTGNQAKAFADNIETLGNKQQTLSTFTKASVEQTNSLQSKMDILSNKIKILSIDIGEGLSKALLETTGYWANFFSAAKNSVTPLQKLNTEITELEEKMAGLKSLGFNADNLDSGPVGEIARANLAAQIDLEQELLRLKRERQAITDAPGIQRELDAIKQAKAELKAIDDQEIIDKRLKETTIVNNKKALTEAAFEEEVLAAQENGALLDAQSFEMLQESIAKEAEAKEIAKARELESKGKHLEALAVLQGIQDKKDLKVYQDGLKKKTTWENATSKQKIDMARSTSGQIMSLASSENKTLAAIGKTAAIANATMSTYEAINKTLAFYPVPFNYALAGAVGLAGFANVSKIAGIQGFQDGGIVPGSSFTGDNVPAKVNSGEMILNAAQQTELFNVAQGGGGGGTEIVLSLKDGLVDFIEAEIIERRALGEATI